MAVKMAMTNVMERVVYEKHNFVGDPQECRHPLWLTEKHYIYHLYQDAGGRLACLKDINNQPMSSPRRLLELCMYKLVCESHILEKVKTTECFLPSNVYPTMLTEAIFHREAQAIAWLVSTWPAKLLRVNDILPLEDYVEGDYLTLPFEDNANTCLVDCFILGLLKLKPYAGLKYLDFTGFPDDPKLCRELCRLPILWMKPEDRTVDAIHEYMSEFTELSKDKVQRFLNRISVVYSNIDADFKHGNQIEPVTILLDMKVTIDDVPFGLSLQGQTPFRFKTHCVWLKHIAGIRLPASNLDRVLRYELITHFEYEEPLLPRDDTKFSSFLDALATLRNLIALSLPNSIDVLVNQEMTSKLNRLMLKLGNLQRLNLAYCNLKNHLQLLLGNMRQTMTYLNLKDCRLSEDDLFFLAVWSPIRGLRELDLSCNNLDAFDQVVIGYLERMPNITCFSVSYCQLSGDSQVLIARECKECSRLKVLCMQGYTPLTPDGVLEVLDICSHIQSLQKLIMFPEAYGFPGNNQLEREENKRLVIQSSYNYLAMRNRTDIELE